jgi:hypothetical protein
MKSLLAAGALSVVVALSLFLVPVSAALCSSAVRGAGSGPLCRADTGPATDRVPPLRPGLALGARPSRPVWAMGPGALRAEPVPLENSAD